jgi:hypothetical protein
MMFGLLDRSSTQLYPSFAGIKTTPQTPHNTTHTTRWYVMYTLTSARRSCTSAAAFSCRSA